MPFLEPMSRYLTESGFGLFSFDSEGGDGQYEFDFDYAPALEMADKLTFFRLMVKQAAKEAGLVATFMPKPYTTGWGSGHHFNMSLAELDDRGEPVPRRRRRTREGLEQARLLVRRRHHAPRGRDRRDRDADGQLVQAAATASRRRHRFVGARVRRVRRQQPFVHVALAAQPARSREPRRRLRREHLPRGRVHARGRDGRHPRRPRPGRTDRRHHLRLELGADRRGPRCPATCSKRSTRSTPTRSRTRCSPRSSSPRTAE